MLVGGALFANELRAAGMEVEELGDDHIMIAGHRVPEGKFEGLKVDIGIVVPRDFPLSPPGGPHVHELIHENLGRTGRIRTGHVHPSKPSTASTLETAGSIGAGRIRTGRRVRGTRCGTWSTSGRFGRASEFSRLQRGDDVRGRCCVETASSCNTAGRGSRRRTSVSPCGSRAPARREQPQC